MKTIPAELFSALNLLVMERRTSYGFEPIAPVPDFAEKLFPQIMRGGMSVIDVRELPFISHFIEDAEPFWQERSSGLLKSEPCIEEDRCGDEYGLEAMAVSVGQREFLVMRPLGTDFEHRRDLLQSAREGMILQRRLEQLVKERMREVDLTSDAALDPSESLHGGSDPDGARTMDKSFPTELLADLGLLILERESALSFRPMMRVPACFSSDFLGVPVPPSGGSLNLSDSDFLADFLAEAEEFWQRTTGGHLSSGPWIEVDEYDNEYSLKAAAVSWQQRKFLVIEVLGADHQESRMRVQNARELFLSERMRRGEAQRTIQDTEAKYESLFEQSADAIIVMKPDGVIGTVNARCRELLGLTQEELANRNIMDLQDDVANKDALRTAMEREDSLNNLDWVISRGDGSKRSCLLNISPWRNQRGGVSGYIGIARDVTQVLALKKQLFHAQKMEAIGNLAGGIAHDFNNILNVTMGFAELAEDELAPGHPARMHLREVRVASVRGADLVNQILTLSRESEKAFQPISATPIIKEALRFLRASMPTTIDIRRRLDAKHDVILADPTQLHQVLMNLCTNAGHAMRETGGILEVGSENLYVDETASGPHPHMAPGPYLRLFVGDTGHGIPPEVQDRIFEPYFTTKRPGEGTGLGLAVVHSIVDTYGGHISVQSTPHSGTTMEVLLPVLTEAFTSDVQSSTELPRGSETILYVDDEPAALQVGKLVLERLGYTVITAVDSMHALDIFRSQPDIFHAVITDMTMPRLTGTRLAILLLNVRRDIPIILCTGYTDLLSKEQAKAKGIKAFLTKPISREALARTLREVLDNK